MSGPSVLFADPGDATRAAHEKPPDYLSDLRLDRIGAALAGADDPLFLRYFQIPLRTTAAVEYRQQVFADLGQATLREQIGNFTTAMDTVRRHLDSAHAQRRHPLQSQRWLVDAVSIYCEAVRALADDLRAATVSAGALRAIAEYLAQLIAQPQFRELSAQADEVHRQLSAVRYTVYVHGLHVHVERYTDAPDYSSEIASAFARFREQAPRDYLVKYGGWSDMNHVEEQLLEGVARLFPNEFATLSRFCADHADFADPVVSTFDREIRFYQAYLRLRDDVAERGVRFCLPQVDSEFSSISVTGAIDMALAVPADPGTKPGARRKPNGPAGPLIPNDFRLDGPERILVVTGPNQGGKTTFARMFGQLAHLAAIGCPVPAVRARLMLADRVFTHFERQEATASLHGKLDDELIRIHDILARATGRSVIVMNESFASTAVQDALDIGRDVLARIVALGAVTVYVTFLDELSDYGPQTVSMVAGVDPDDPATRTFAIARRAADGQAFASAIAGKYRLTYPQLAERIGARAAERTTR